MENQNQILRVLSYNVQVGIATSRARHYLTGSWKHVLPHTQRLTNLDQAASMIHGYDIVGLQEVDAGSIRSNFINLAEYMADRAEFPFWYHQVNRNLGRIAQHSNGLLSHFKPGEVRDIKLPGLIPGRQAIMAVYDSGKSPLAVFILHLALSKRARLQQLEYISEMVNEFPHAIVMGDMNCKVNSREMRLLFDKTGLREPLEELHTFPSWRPQSHIDHILVTSDLKVKNMQALSHDVSDHLPLSMEIELPDDVNFIRDEHYKSQLLEKSTKKSNIS
ncbi:MAG: endonuclease/exonuclease/phosphatase family protein [Gammaproteobacteria bacterium]|nr:endonuclease/exonuclease/phosphatase family protein [Gammaproteobacteria bacterium]